MSLLASLKRLLVAGRPRRTAWPEGSRPELPLTVWSGDFGTITATTGWLAIRRGDNPLRIARGEFYQVRRELEWASRAALENEAFNGAILSEQGKIKLYSRPISPAGVELYQPGRFQMFIPAGTGLEVAAWLRQIDEPEPLYPAATDSEANVKINEAGDVIFGSAFHGIVLSAKNCHRLAETARRAVCGNTTVTVVIGDTTVSFGGHDPMPLAVTLATLGGQTSVTAITRPELARLAMTLAAHAASVSPDTVHAPGRSHE